MVVIWTRIRHAAKGIQDTEWLLLVLEALGVVLGVFIAFQLQQWAENRREARTHDRLMDRLLDEARDDLRYMGASAEQRQPGIDQAGAIVLGLNAGTCPGSEKMETLWQMGFYPAIRAPETVYNEMVNSTGLSSIDDDAVRNAIVAYRREIEFIVGQNESFGGNFGLLEQKFPGLSFRYDPESRDLGDLQVDPAVVCSNPDFVSFVNGSVRNQRRMQQYRYHVVQVAAHMCFELARERGEQCFAGSLADMDETWRVATITMEARLHDGDLEYHAEQSSR